MRVVGEIAHPSCRITLLSWNNRYLIKLEQGMLEQTFKIDQFDVSGENDLKQLLDDQFITGCLARFDEMSKAFYDAMMRLNNV